MVDFAARIKPIGEYIVVDGACDQSTGVAEYRGSLYEDGVEKHVMFRMGPFTGSTNNIVEFLALVHALAHCNKEGWTMPVYSDSVTAIAWVRDNRMNTSVKWGDHNKELKMLCIRAEKWLRDNAVRNKVMKWLTKEWGENPADFGYKR